MAAEVAGSTAGVDMAAAGARASFYRVEAMLVMIIQMATRGMPKVFVMFEPHPDGSNITKTVPSNRKPL